MDGRITMRNVGLSRDSKEQTGKLLNASRCHSTGGQGRRNQQGGTGHTPQERGGGAERVWHKDQVLKTGHLRNRVHAHRSSRRGHCRSQCDTAAETPKSGTSMVRHHQALVRRAGTGVRSHGLATADGHMLMVNPTVALGNADTIPYRAPYTLHQRHV